jgi:hydroxyacylglutathione hydrolase
MNLVALTAFADNYIWMLHDGRSALVVDPGDSRPVFDALQSHGLKLSAILVTHHHADHMGGVAALYEATGAQVFGPAREAVLPDSTIRLRDGERCTAMDVEFRVIDVPGHTAGHIAFWGSPAGQSPLLFCGDTLFSAGCGKLFEGTPAQMLASLDVLAALPADTRVCCGHEYTLSNLKFAQAVEPANVALGDYLARCQELRSRSQPTLPSLMGTELQVNPFLRTRQPAVIAAASAFDPAANDEVAVFAAVRQWKNEFR